MKPPPPMPATYGSVTPSVALAATAASTALPPRRSTSMAVRVASRSTLAAAPPLPTAGGEEAVCAPAGGARAASTSTPTQNRTHFCRIAVRFPGTAQRETTCARIQCGEIRITQREVFATSARLALMSTGTPWEVAASVAPVREPAEGLAQG